MSDHYSEHQTGMVSLPDSQALELYVHPDLYRAFRRCTWIIINETGREQIDIYNEMVRDFLVKYGC